MNSFRNHRVIIASLFLPVTIETLVPDDHANGSSNRNTVYDSQSQVKREAPTTILQEPNSPTDGQGAAHIHRIVESKSKGPLNSILEDLAVKVVFHCSF
jgi:hypothetical protein